jgi:hypothetical protein
MPAGSTYSTIATTTLGSNTASYTFSSISGSYTDLVLIAMCAGTANTDLYLNFNGDTGSNYSRTYVAGNGAAAYSGRNSNLTGMPQCAYATFGTTLGQFNAIISINSYSNTITNKTVLARASRATDAAAEVSVGLWRSTAAITSIIVGTGTGLLLAGSTFTLYGITAA